MEIIADIDKLYELLLQFHTLTKLRIVLYDNEFNKILAVPRDEGAFCSYMRKCREFDALCSENDKNAQRICAKSGATHMYTCHCGLQEAISPVKMDGMILGYVMLGQLIEKSAKKENKESIIKYAQTFCRTENIDKLYDKISTQKHNQINAAVKIMETCICYLWVNNLINVSENCLSAMISQYIKQNLTDDLSVRPICVKFGISKNKLYKLSHESFGMSIAAYIRACRLENAALLLKSGATVAEAAVLSGINDYNYFSLIFKKQYGVLPSKYAKSNTTEIRRTDVAKQRSASAGGLQ